METSGPSASAIPASPAQAADHALPIPARVALLAFLAFGTYVRVAGVWCQALYGDEEHAHRHLMTGYADILRYYDALGSHVALPLLQRAAMDLFGPSVVVYRLPSLAAGLLGLWLLYPLGRRLVGGAPACLATALVAVLPLHVYYSRFARSYSLVFLLALVLVHGLVRALEGRRRAWLGVGLAAGLLPWVHLSTTGPVAALALVTLALAARQPARAALGPALLAFGGAAALALALFAPGMQSLIESVRFLSSKRDTGGASLTDVLTLLGGSAAGGWAVAAGGLVAGVLLARRGRAAGPIFLTALVAPGVTVWLWRPLGAETAYSRYQLVAVVPLVLGSAWAFCELLGRSPRLRGGPAYASGLALVCLQAVLRPFPVEQLFSTFPNHRFWLQPDPAAARPFSGTPAIYHELARASRALTVVEFPLTLQAVPLLDNYQRQHRQRTLVGVTREVEGAYSRSPYVPVLDLDLAAGEVDCVIVHKDVMSEVERFRAEAWPLQKAPSDGLVLEEGLLNRFHEIWGPPSYEDGFVQAWMAPGVEVVSGDRQAR